jgi:hypothetical protein
MAMTDMLIGWLQSRSAQFRDFKGDRVTDKIVDWLQNQSWRVGYRDGFNGKPYRTPWWADAMVHAYAHVQGKEAAAKLSAKGNRNGDKSNATR